MCVRSSVHARCIAAVSVCLYLDEFDAAVDGPEEGEVAGAVDEVGVGARAEQRRRALQAAAVRRTHQWRVACTVRCDCHPIPAAGRSHIREHSRKDHNRSRRRRGVSQPLERAPWRVLSLIGLGDRRESWEAKGAGRHGTIRLIFSFLTFLAAVGSAEDEVHVSALLDLHTRPPARRAHEKKKEKPSRWSVRGSCDVGAFRATNGICGDRGAGGIARAPSPNTRGRFARLASTPPPTGKPAGGSVLLTPLQPALFRSSALPFYRRA